MIPETAETNVDNKYSLLPKTATKIIVHGNNWYEFTLSGKRMLFHRATTDAESLVVISEVA